MLIVSFCGPHLTWLGYHYLGCWIEEGLKDKKWTNQSEIRLFRKPDHLLSQVLPRHGEKIVHVPSTGDDWESLLCSGYRANT